jgi:hypothetical protein
MPDCSWLRDHCLLSAYLLFDLLDGRVAVLPEIGFDNNGCELIIAVYTFNRLLKLTSPTLVTEHLVLKVRFSQDQK